MSPESSADAGPWTLFRNAGVMMQMADYIARNARGFDWESLQEFRANAVGLRLAAIKSLIHLPAK